MDFTNLYKPMEASMTYRRVTRKQFALAGLCGFGLAVAVAMMAPVSVSAQSSESLPVAQEADSLQVPSPIE